MIASAPILKNAIVQPPQQCVRRLPVGNVLLAGHIKDELDTLAGYLNGSYDLFTARNVNGVMKMIDAHPINLVIAGTMLDGADGSKLCELLKSSDSYSHIPVILLIEKDTVLSRLRILQSGADAYLEKPTLYRQILMAQVSNVIANRARVKNYFAHTLYAHVDVAPGPKASDIFVKRLNHCIDENLPDQHFDIDALAKQLNMSRPTLYRKVKCVSDMTPNELINAARLKKAAELLLTSDRRVFEIAKMVGFNSRSNFGKIFFKKFNMTPTIYQQIFSTHASASSMPPV